MIEVDFNRDIKNLEPKFIMNLTKHQCKWLLIGLIYAVPICAVVPLKLYGRILLGVVLLIPALIVGTIKWYHMNMDVFIFRWLYARVWTPSRRKRTSQNTIRRAYDALLKEDEREALKRLSAKERKKLEKQKESGPKV